ncbi:MAG: YIP1 family protein [Clostridia bacterium]|nr:YIP1 family protein [Clostridia bacterium]
MKRFLIFLLAFAVLFGTVSVSAETYTYDYWGNAVSAPNGYTVDKTYFGGDLGVGAMKNPGDIFVAADGSVYICDTGNNRVICLDESYKVTRIITELSDGGTPLALQTPEGIFVDKEGNSYICLKEAGLVVKADKEGNITAKFTRPESDLLQDTFEFKPSRVLVSDSGTVFVMIKGFYLGALVYNQQGEFITFFGSNDVKVTAKMVADQLFRKLMTEEQKSKLSRYIPVQYDGFDIDKNNFIYTCTSGATSQEIRRINTLGSNVLAEKGNMGDLQSAYILGKVEDTSFVDLCVDENGFITAIDNTRGRVFQYDKDGILVTVFGGKGDGTGLFASPCAIDEQGESLLVLDSERACFTVLKTTEYGALLREGTVLFNKGLYSQSRLVWNEVLSKNANCELAYNGLGKAEFAEENYAEAMRCFKLANNRDEYSESFKEYRSIIIKQVFPYVISGIVILAAAIFVITKLTKRFGKGKKASMPPTLKSFFRVMTHPSDEIGEIKYKKQWNYKLATGVLALWFGASVAKKQITAFIFNYNDPDRFNVLVELVSTVGLFLLFVVINWAVTTLLAGKGRVGEIYCSSAYALLPYVISVIVSVALSHFTVTDEGAFLTIIEVVGLLWSVFLLVFVLREIHEYTFGKVFKSLFLTLCGMAFVIFIGMLFISLIEQLVSFVNSIFNELMYRR